METVLYSGPERSARIVGELLGSHFVVKTGAAEAGPLLALFKDCTVFLDASMKVQIPAEAIESADKLRLIVTATTGANHIDAQALQRRNIPLLTLKGQKEILRDLTPAAEHSWLLLMSCARHLRGAVRHVETGRWERTEFPGLMLKGNTAAVTAAGLSDQALGAVSLGGFFSNLIPVTLGNMVGGILFVAVFYFFIFKDGLSGIE